MGTSNHIPTHLVATRITTMGTREPPQSQVIIVKTKHKPTPIQQHTTTTLLHITPTSTHTVHGTHHTITTTTGTIVTTITTTMVDMFRPRVQTATTQMGTTFASKNVAFSW